MKQNLQTNIVAFPTRLMSSARNPAGMAANFARELLNLYTSRGGAGAKRNGFSLEAASCPATITCLMPFIAGDGSLQILAGGDNGSIYLRGESDWVEVFTGLNPLGKIRWTQFAGKLILCNGMDDIMAWNGTSFTVISQWVTDLAPGLAYVDDFRLTINSSPSLYTPGRVVRLRLGAGEYVNATIAESETLEGVITITFTEPVVTSNLDQLAYETRPPRFQYLYAAHDRLWGMGEGPLKANSFSASATRTTVFYTAGLNDETAWYDTQGILPYINLADKMPQADELVGMAVKDGLTAFFGRNAVQLWSGDTPGVDGNFVWQKNIPVGAIHADLICEMPADVAFFTRFGVRTLSRVLQTEQLDIGDLGAEIDPGISAALAILNQDDEHFQNAHSCRYDRQGWFAFKVAQRCFVFQATMEGSGWTEFDGLFKNATAFLTAPDGNLYAAVSSTLYRYNESSFADDETPITLRWWTPWFTPGNKRWANKYLELLAESDANTSFTIRRLKSYDASHAVDYNLDVPGKGDYWDSAPWDDTYWDSGVNPPRYIRDSFISSSFAYIFENTSAHGPIQILGLKLHGKEER